ncbi:MAG: lamin tail domain-containing protein [Bacteroidales bacterium]
MKIVCFSVVCIAFFSSIAFGQVRDDFSDGNFTVNPEWSGDTGQFEVNSYGQLHLNASGSDTSVLFTRSSRIQSTEWSFWMKMSFNTSSSNHARIYLSADTNLLSAISEGCFLQAGGGDDSLLIRKQAGTVVTTIHRFKSYKTLHSTNILRVKITHNDTGLWEAFIDTTGGSNYLSEGTFSNETLNSCRWFGLMCRYTSSNATKFYFDDIYVGPVLHDSIPPRISAVEAGSNGVLKLTFSEPVMNPDAEMRENYRRLSQNILPDSVLQDLHHPEIISVFLHDSLAQGTVDSLQIQHIRDLSGNSIGDTIVQFFCYQPKTYDVLIHEIMADPDPLVGLPAGEYAELYNRSEFPINMKDWSLQYGSYSKVFPPVILPSKGFLLIVKDSAFLNFGRCAVLFTSSTSLSNEGTRLILKDPFHHVIHSVSYSPDWYQGSFKGEGGWSLEMNDPGNPCGCLDNWSPSEDPAGGTPGRANSGNKKNPDVDSPVALRAVITGSATLNVTFSESMDSTTVCSSSRWRIFHPDGEWNLSAILPVPPDFSMVTLQFPQPFVRGIIYRLKVVDKMKDCAGNSCDTSRIVRFAIPDTIVEHDVVINEILSNPASGGSRFLELLNRSEKIVDLQSLVVSNRDTSEGFAANAMPLLSSGFLLFPGDHIAFTGSREDVVSRYRPPFPENIISMDGFPVFGDDTGTVVIARKDNLVIIDRMKYHAGMHYPLLATTEGVSLERNSPDLPSGDQDNWHSAAETVGFATPGYQNSHRLNSGEGSAEIEIQPELFSPDNDGRDDLLFLTIRENEPDYAVNIVVYDDRGRLIRQLANNVLTGSEGIFIWDGMTETRSKAPVGFYIMLVELTKPDGTVKRTMLTAVLGGNL